MFVDSHCHLDFDSLEPQLEEVLSRARAAGVGRFVAVGTTKSGFAKIQTIAETHDDVDCTFGVHPHEAEKPGEKVKSDEIIAYAAHPKVIGIGETGLDYYYDHAPREAQQRNFREHIRACIATGLPLVIHTREAEEDTIRILEEERAGEAKPLRGVFHCYSSHPSLVSYGLSIGFYFSFSGMVTFKKTENVRDSARMVPMDRLLVETDAPYLAPEPYRGQTCEPAFVTRTAAFLADLKGQSLAEMERATTDNFFTLFQKAARP